MSDEAFPSGCPDEDTLARYLQGALDGARLARVRAHVVACATCRDVLVDAVQEIGLDGTTERDAHDTRGAGGIDDVTVLNGKYRVLEELGRGGMGRVFRARHLGLERDVAIKMMQVGLLGDARAVRRFEREARAVAALDHPHVVKILDIDWLPGGAPFIVMELLEGEDLARVLGARGRLEPAEAVGYVLEATRGIGAAHANGILHRDLKPQNLFLARRALGGPRVKILDFGTATLPERSERRSLRDGLPASGFGRVGTPYFMSPEQVALEPLDASTDLWSLGATLFTLVAGRPPFIGDDADAVFDAILHTPAPRLSSMCPDAPRALVDVVGGCLETRRRDRYPSAAALAAALTELSAVLATSEPPPVTEPLPTIAARPRDRR